MKLKGKFAADIVDFHIKANKSGREATIDIDLGVKEEEAAEKLGEEFHALAFSTMRTISPAPDDPEKKDEGNKIGFLLDKIPPGKNVVYGRHAIEINGHRMNEQPELLTIITIDGAARVVARYRIPFDVQKGELLTKLAQAVGKTVTVTFEAEQPSFEFKKKPKKGAAAEPAQAAETPATTH